MKHLLAAALGVAALTFTPAAHADPIGGPGMCQYLGQQYPIYYPCDSNPQWLPYGTVGNPPVSGPYQGSNCSEPMNQHNQGCS